MEHMKKERGIRIGMYMPTDLWEQVRREAVLDEVPTSRSGMVQRALVYYLSLCAKCGEPIREHRTKVACVKTRIEEDKINFVDKEDVSVMV